MSEELKPCRRCGNSDLATASYVANNGEIFISVACMKCPECYSIEFWQTDNARESALRAENEQLRHALSRIVYLINSAGLSNLSNGVQLGQMSWHVKASDALAFAEKVLEQAKLDAKRGTNHE